MTYNVFGGTLNLAQPQPSISCLIKIQNGFIFLLLAYSGYL